MAQIEEIRKARLKKLHRLRNYFINPYPLKSTRTHKIGEVLKGFNKFLKTKEELRIAGRIRGMRIHGGATFLDIEDESGKIQGFLRKDTVGESGYDFFLNNIDIGDFLEIKGQAMKTRKGEKTIIIYNFKILTKSLRPLPEKWHGLKDIEERFRKRYLDLIFNKDVKSNFILRAKIVSFLRKFLEKEGFIEVETPILQPIYGGARAKPFITHLNALDLDLYLRISPELYLKRLLVGGFEKVFEIGKCFRNEGMDRFHNPDFTMLEFYWAFADYKDMMRLTERMISELVKKTLNTKEILFQGRSIHFKTPWPRIEFDHLFRKETGLDYDTYNQKAILKKAIEMGLQVAEYLPKFEVADEIFKKIIRPKIWQPTFVIHYPVGFQPLAKALEKRPNRLANFQLIVGGIELVNAFSELNDPVEQMRRFEEQEKLFKRGFEEAQRMDMDFIEALEYGMPPSAGFGMGIDRLVLLLTNSSSIRESILFPTMKPL